MDDTLPEELHPALAVDGCSSASVRFIDFRGDISPAQVLLDRLLQREEFVPIFFEDDLKMNNNLVRATRMKYATPDDVTSRGS
jgi:hypothetical protein